MQLQVDIDQYRYDKWDYQKKIRSREEMPSRALPVIRPRTNESFHAIIFILVRQACTSDCIPSSSASMDNLTSTSPVLVMCSSPEIAVTIQLDGNI